MLKNITFSAEEQVIKRARERAEIENTTLNEQFRQWLEKYAERTEVAKTYNKLMEQFSYVVPGRSYTRDELNER